MKRYRFERRGPLALAAAAWGLEFDATPPPAPTQKGGVAVVQIRGPLTHHSDWFCDSYDAIKDRVAAALGSPATVVVLDIDSPGGDVSGCYETSRELRAMAEAAGKPLYAYANGMACSGGYALACAAEKIYLPAEALVGSIGVITMAVDMTAADRAMGLHVTVVASGKRKLDGNPHTPISDDAVAAFKATVDDLAELFFALVSERRGLPVEEVRGLEAGLLHGEKAVKAGLADGVATWGEFIALVAKGELGGGAAKEERVDEKEIVEALRSLAESDDEEKAAKAKKALAALEGEDEEDEAEKTEEESEEPKAKADGDSDGEEPKASKASARAGAPRATSSTETLAAENIKLHNELKRVKLHAEIKARTDLSAAVRDWLLAEEDSAVVRRFLDKTPKATAPRSPKASQKQTGPALLEGRERDELDEGMGLRKASASGPGKDEAGRFVINVETPAQTRARLAAQKGA